MSEVFQQQAALSRNPSEVSGRSSADAPISMPPDVVEHQHSRQGKVVVVNVADTETSSSSGPGSFGYYFMHCVCCPCFAPFWPCCILDELCGWGCRCRADFYEKQTVEFDCAQRTVTLRQFVALYCSCEEVLVAEQRLPLDCIDSFKCARSEVLGLGLYHVVVVAIKDDLAEHDRDAPFFYKQSWPAFIEHGIFDSGLLLLLSCRSSNGTNKKLVSHLHSDNILASRDVGTCLDAQELRAVVSSLNTQLELMRSV